MAVLSTLTAKQRVAACTVAGAAVVVTVWHIVNSRKRGRCSEHAETRAPSADAAQEPCSVVSPSMGATRIATTAMSRHKALKGEPQKGVRMLKSYRQPETQRKLPQSLLLGNSRVSLPIDLAMSICKAVAEEFLEINTDSLTGTVPEILEKYELTDYVKTRMSPGHIHELMRKCVQLCSLYETLIKDVIGPHLVREFERETAAELAAESGPVCQGRRPCDEGIRTVVYQFPPTIRIYGSHLKLPSGECKELGETRVPYTDEQRNYRALGRFHNDAQYGHQEGEVNFWMPLTSVDKTSTLWAENEADKGDWYPFYPMAVGEIWRFPGTFCRHFTTPNVSGKTRVSLDFRCSVRSCFDRTWKLPGMINRHEMREVIIG